MTISRFARPEGAVRPGETLLRRSGLAWFVVAATGQAAFIWMIVAHYGRNSLAGTPAGWNDKPLIKGYVPGDDAGNLMFAVHVLLAAIVTLAGLLQLVPAIRQRMPVLHRWNGRLFVAIACIMALGGFWLTWVRHTYLSLVSAFAVSLNGGLILLCVTLAWWMASRRRFEDHRRWAMRAFLVVNGVWFLRVSLMAWVLMSGGGMGMNRTLSGPADIVIQFCAYLLPLVILQAYLLAQKSHRASVKVWVGALVWLMTVVTAVGITGAIAFMWGPFMA